LAAYTANPSLQHHGALKRILRYLVGTKTLGITYSNSQDATENRNLFHGYADAAYANTNNHKSTTGYVFISAGGAITWKSKKQTIIALSSTESEFIALSKAG
jgi:KUP system potassium uptake protein